MLIYNCNKDIEKNGVYKMITNKTITDYAINECDLTLTNNLNESLYLMTNGKMINGCDEYGERSEDHRCMLDLILNGKNYYTLKDPVKAWIKLHRETGLIRICPETKTALISTGQTLTTRQKDVLNNFNYQVEEYI